MSENKWPKNVKELINVLHTELSINNNDWHTLKSNPERRAAELLSGSLAQLVNNGKTEDIEAMIEQGLLWLKREVKDPGCPRK